MSFYSEQGHPSVPFKWELAPGTPVRAGSSTQHQQSSAASRRSVRQLPVRDTRPLGSLLGPFVEGYESESETGLSRSRRYGTPPAVQSRRSFQCFQQAHLAESSNSYNQRCSPLELQQSSSAFGSRMYPLEQPSSEPFTERCESQFRASPSMSRSRSRSTGTGLTFKTGRHSVDGLNRVQLEESLQAHSTGRSPLILQPPPSAYRSPGHPLKSPSLKNTVPLGFSSRSFAESDEPGHGASLSRSKITGFEYPLKSDEKKDDSCQCQCECHNGVSHEENCSLSVTTLLQKCPPKPPRPSRFSASNIQAKLSSLSLKVTHSSSENYSKSSLTTPGSRPQNLPKGGAPRLKRSSVRPAPLPTLFIECLSGGEISSSVHPLD
jgi:hypothetical protein